MSRAYRAMQDNSSPRFKSPSSSESPGSRRRSASSRRQRARALARRSEQSPRSTTTCESCSPGLGIRFCPKCGVPIGTQTADEIVEKILHLPEGSKVFVMAPVERRDGERYEALWDDLRASGFARVRIDGQSISLDNPPKLSHRRKHKVEVVVDRAVVRRSTRSRLADSIESALDLGKGVVHVARVGEESREPSWVVERFSQHRVCDRCSRSFDELAPHHFSFNSPLGWCPVCQGLGVQQGANPARARARRAIEPARRRGGRLARFRGGSALCADDRNAGQR